MKYLENAFNGYNHWWRYLILFLASFLGGQTIGGLPLMGVMFYQMFASGGTIQPNPENMADLSVYGIDPNLGLFLMLLPFVCSLVILLLMVKPIHHRIYTTIITGAKKIRWNRFFMAAAVWAALSGVYLISEYLINPDNFTFNFDTSSFIILLIVSLCLIPLQASYEEVLFRGYLAQGIAVWTKSRWMVILIPSILFGLVHVFNPEIKEYGFFIVMPQYIFFGLLFGLFTVLDDGIEVAMGAHSANNIFLSLFVTNKSSALQTPALLTQNELDPVKDLIILILLGVVFTAIFTAIYKWKFNIFTKKIESIN